MIEIVQPIAGPRSAHAGSDGAPDAVDLATGFEAIRWRDSGMQLASDEWTPIASLRARSVASAMEVVTVGLLVHEDDDVVVLGLSVDRPGDAVFGAQAIWKSAIIERRGLSGLFEAPDV